MSDAPLNNLGGDMPQERLDRIKEAWMSRYEKTEEDWLNFQPSAIQSTSEDSGSAEAPLILDDPSLIHFEWPLCPTYEELGRRMKGKADYYGNLSKKFSGTAVGRKYKEECASYLRLALGMFERSREIHRKAR